MNRLTAYDRRLADVLVPENLAGSGADPRCPRQGGLIRGDLVLRAGIVVAVLPGAGTPAPRIVLPALVEAHCHLDKCHTVGRLAAVGGDLASAVAVQSEDKRHWSEADLRARGAKGLAEAVAAGCGLVRSHVDWGDAAAPPLAWHVLGDLAAERNREIVLDRAALLGADALADPDLALAVAREVAADRGALGAFVLDQSDRASGIRAAFALADRFGLALDFHVDEGLSQGLDGLELIADVAIETRFQGPVLCGHACSLMNRSGGDLARLLDKLSESGICVAALPTTNLYLQGRGTGTPDRRGLTRLRELTDAGVPVVVGSDNVADAFCPVGRHDPMAALHLAALAAHLDPPLARWLDLITTNAARALGRDAVSVLGAKTCDLRISAATGLSELISGRAGPLQPLNSYLESLAE